MENCDKRHQKRFGCWESEDWKCVNTWRWLWGSAPACSLWSGCCIRRKGLQTQSGLLGSLQSQHSRFPQCRPQTAAGKTSHLAHACSLRYTWSDKRSRPLVFHSYAFVFIYSFYFLIISNVGKLQRPKSSAITFIYFLLRLVVSISFFFCSLLFTKTCESTNKVLATTKQTSCLGYSSYGLASRRHKKTKEFNVNVN